MNEVLVEIDTSSPIWEWQGASPAGQFGRQIHLIYGEILAHFIKTGNKRMALEVLWVPEVTIQPLAIFEGLDRAGQEEALCYCGIPTGEFAKMHGQTLQFPVDQTFMVFLTKELKVTKYRACEVEPGTNGLPIGHQARFRREIWRRE